MKPGRMPVPRALDSASFGITAVATHPREGRESPGEAEAVAEELNGRLGWGGWRAEGGHRPGEAEAAAVRATRASMTGGAGEAAGGPRGPLALGPSSGGPRGVASAGGRVVAVAMGAAEAGAVGGGAVGAAFRATCAGAGVRAEAVTVGGFVTPQAGLHGAAFDPCMAGAGAGAVAGTGARTRAGTGAGMRAGAAAKAMLSGGVCAGVAEFARALGGLGCGRAGLPTARPAVRPAEVLSGNAGAAPAALFTGAAGGMVWWAGAGVDCRAWDCKGCMEVVRGMGCLQARAAGVGIRAVAGTAPWARGAA